MTFMPPRPRLVLTTAALPAGDESRSALGRALGAGDVASVIIAPRDGGEAAFQAWTEELVPLIQSFGAAALICDDTRCLGRVKADGLHVSAGRMEELQDAVARFSPRLIVGASGFRTRHAALEAGERLPSYMMFGEPGADTGPAADPQDLELARWWADIVEIPCILQGGNSLEHLPEAIESGAEFIALSAAIFAEPGREAERVVQANALLVEHAVRQGA